LKKSNVIENAFENGDELPGKETLGYIFLNSDLEEIATWMSVEKSNQKVKHLPEAKIALYKPLGKATSQIAPMRSQLKKKKSFIRLVCSEITRQEHF